jgi:ribosome-associated protein
MIYITPTLAIDESEIEEEFVRSSGPGGQNVNKVATGVQLRFDVAGSPSLPEDVRDRLMKLAGRRLTSEGVLVIEARQFRTQAQNRADALQRLIGLIYQATKVPPPRRKTRATLAAQKRRLEIKRRRSETKRLRQRLSGREQ